MNLQTTKLEEQSRITKSLIFPALFVLLLWIVKLLEKNSSITFHHFGIFPRTLDGLIGIIGSPLVHADFSHLINNSIPLLILGSCLFYFYKDIALKVFILIWLIGNIWLWSIARPSYHIGASGIVYGLVCFLFLSGILRKNKALMVVSLLVTFLYGSLVWGVLPIDYHISFEGHLMGSLAGILLAVYYRERGPQKEEYIWEEEEAQEAEEVIIDFQEMDSEIKPQENIEIKLDHKIVCHYKPKE